MATVSKAKTYGRPGMDYLVIDHGARHQRFFMTEQDLSPTLYRYMVCGSGENFRDALMDAIDGIACQGWIMTACEITIAEQRDRTGWLGQGDLPSDHPEEIHYFVSVLWGGGGGVK